MTNSKLCEVTSMNRRYFIKSGGIALASFGVMAAAPSFLKRALAETLSAPSARRKTLIAIFQRGAVDGLNMVVPYGESAYYDLRPSVLIPKPNGGAEAAISLDGFFGLHPSLSSFKPLWESKRRSEERRVGKECRSDVKRLPFPFAVLCPSRMVVQKRRSVSMGSSDCIHRFRHSNRFGNQN